MEELFFLNNFRIELEMEIEIYSGPEKKSWYSRIPMIEIGVIEDLLYYLKCLCTYLGIRQTWGVKFGTYPTPVRIHQWL